MTPTDPSHEPTEPGRMDDATTARRNGGTGPASAPSSDVHVCDVCGTPMYDRHCKIVCPSCGYLRDCSDP